MKFSMTGQERVTFKYKWLLNRGDHMYDEQVWLNRGDHMYDEQVWLNRGAHMYDEQVWLYSNISHSRETTMDFED